MNVKTSNIFKQFFEFYLTNAQFKSLVVGRAGGRAAGQGRGDCGAEERVRQGHRQRDGQPEVRTMQINRVREKDQNKSEISKL